MGYRSQVAVKVASKHAEKIQELFKPIVGEIDDDDEVLLDKDGKVVGYHLRWIKWNDTYPEIQEIESFLCDLPDDEFGLIEIGEDYTDVRFEGRPDKYEMYLSREIFVD